MKRKCKGQDDGEVGGETLSTLCIEPIMAAMRGMKNVLELDAGLDLHTLQSVLKYVRYSLKLRMSKVR